MEHATEAPSAGHEGYIVALTPRTSLISNQDAEKEHTNMETEPVASKCRLWCANPSVLILIGCVLGVILGYLLGQYGASKELLTWITLPGELFLRALTCVVVPLVFVNIFLSVVDMLRAGHAAKSGLYTLGLFGLTTVLAVLLSISSVSIFKKWFSHASSTSKNAVNAGQSWHCGNTTDLSVQWFQNGTILCSTPSDASSPLVLPSPSAAPPPSLSKTVQDQIFRALVPDNIVQQFVSGNYLGIMAIATMLAFSLDKVSPRPVGIVRVCEELNAMLLVCIRLIIDITPIAVFSLVAGGLGATSDLTAALSDVGIFLVSFLVAIMLHYWVTLMGILYLVLRTSPIQAMKTCWPAQVFAFCSASSAATLPITLKCGDQANVPASLASFILTMGATLNMNGTSIYFPCAVIYLAVSTGDEANFTVVSYILLGLLSSMSAAAAAPVPSAALVLVVPMFNAVCGTANAPTPANFSYLLAMDFLLDRFRTWLNVSGDLVIAQCVAAMDCAAKNAPRRVSDSTDESDSSV
ncbi:hypothetical protein H310_05425 [Aphanomyces invadans]|uniref:Amino acid transporter n=1 Tax=Aphanomyces invadans TaxID=157072 RepID=A0A024U9W2_9STRA|nr:hypothetical protein H310_05425 [Aphanomyces invadans]ETW02985.1 hypothetical protein H310_05425 [Aphanomyces invadans]|eukprot:XP_008868369.1 hypothetical protein H310_05425 [Aphanomyces invadans]